MDCCLPRIFISLDTKIPPPLISVRPRSERLKNALDRTKLKPETYPPENLNQPDFLGSLKLIPNQPGQSQQHVNGYQHIVENEIVSEPRNNIISSKCTCPPEECCTEMCLNRLLSVECDATTCPAKDQCQNQKFRRGSLYNTEIRLSENKGYGLFAMEPIPSGSFIVEYVGEVIDQIEFKKRFKTSQATGQFYFMALEEGFYIDAQHQGNKSRFINHSCAPNTKAVKWTVDKQTRLGFFAIKDIGRVS